MDLPAALQVTAPAPTLLGREILAVDRDAGTARMRFNAQPDFTNRHGSVQGGFVAAMLDSATSVALIATLPDELTSVTMRLETVYLKPTPVGELFAVAWVTARGERDATAEARLEGADGTVFATATAALRIRPKT
jgi:uncharacterized protein (TIGR00369 family)